MESVSPSSLESQKNEITQLMQTSISVESVWYLIDIHWLKQWKKYVGYDEWESGMIGEEAANPGPIDNSNLLEDDCVTLKENLSDEIEYSLLPKAAWDKMVSWYGLQQGQEPLERHVIEHGLFVKHRKVEVYFLQLKLCSFADVTRLVTRHFSHASTIAKVKEVAKEVFDIPADREIRLWNNYLNNTYESLARFADESTLQDAGFYSGSMVVVETKKEDGSWQREENNSKGTSVVNSMSTSASGGTSYSNKSVTNMYGLNSATNANSLSLSNTTANRLYNSSAYSNTSYYDGYRSAAGPGLCGLGNLGNTCFMNSAIQCLSNVSALTEYMVDDRWKEELNVNNPLGMHGEVAISYAELIKILWCGKYSYTIPRNFKISVGRFKPEFSGYQQQDSQELMAFLLDGLHEDLNRIKKKPYVETKEANNRPDKEVAEEAWSDYIKRNDSIIVDIFHGLLKSTLVCPECRKVSVKFDPFCYLSLPLPVKKERQIEVILVPWDPMRKLRQFKLTVQKMGIVSHLCSALSQLTRILRDKMLVVDVYNHRFHKVFSPNDSLTQIMDRDDIFVYELPAGISDDKELKLIPIYMRLDRSRLFGLPTLIAIKYKGCTYEYLYNSIVDRMARYIRRPESHRQAHMSVTSQGDRDDDVDHQSADDEISDDDRNSQSNGDKTDMKSESSDEEGNGDEDGSNGDDQLMCRLFTLSFVNIYGNTEVSRLSDDGRQIKFGGQYPYLAADWQNALKDRFYDEKSAEELEIDDSMNNKPMPKKQSIQLSECMELFTTNELLGEHDLWYCPVCKRHEQATKKFDIWQLPQVLVIHLKRFSYTRYWRDKLDTFVDFPIYGLDMSHWVINPNHGPAVYDLLAVSNHYGGMGGGHYTAFAKNKNDDQWYHFDDSSVSATTEDSVVTKAGYVLVYERRDAVVASRRKKRSTASAAAGKADSVNCDDERVENDMDIN